MAFKADERSEGEEHDYVEDAVASDAEINVNALTDEDLRRGGLVKFPAYVRTRRGKDALRSKQNRERKLDDGIKQLNLQAPANDNARAALKNVAKALCEGKLSAEQLTTLTRGPSAMDAELAKCRTVLQVGGWRAWIIRRLLP